MNESYFPGGWLPDHPNGNVAERFVDNGDGTGTRTTYDEHGNETSVEQVTGLPIPEQATEAPDPFEAFSATLRAQLPGATTIAKMRSALTDALDDLDAALGTP